MQLKSGDHIYGNNTRICINNDGSEKSGFYTPGIKGQTEVITKVLDKTNINPCTISLY
ncbi:hypothetical protein AB8Q19_02190 [Candidatus Profftella armatura]